MQAWRRLGAFIGDHLLVIIPIGLAIGVCFPQTLSWMKPAVPALFAVMTFQNSLGNEVSGLRDVLHRPAPLLIALVFVHVFVPLLAFGLGTLIFSGAPHGSDILTGFALEYAVPVGSSTIMWISLFEGDISLGLATLLVSTLLAPFSIPATVKLLVGASVSVDTVGMMRDMILMIALPAIAGTATNELTHGPLACAFAACPHPFAPDCLHQLDGHLELPLPPHALPGGGHALRALLLGLWLCGGFRNRACDPTAARALHLPDLLVRRS